jgi:cysteinyl-tRNA synthetase
MTLKFFILQAHYRGTLDFGNEALKAAEKGLSRLFNALKTLVNLKPGNQSDFNVKALEEQTYNALNEDFNTPIAIAQLFEAASWINKINDGSAQLIQEDLAHLSNYLNTFVFDILGLKNEQQSGDESQVDALMQIVLTMRNEAKAAKDFKRSDEIRQHLLEAGFEIKDGKEGTTYSKLRN